MAVSNTILCLCTLTVVTLVTVNNAYPLSDEEEQKQLHETEAQILSHIENKLKQIKEDLEILEELDEEGKVLADRESQIVHIPDDYYPSTEDIDTNKRSDNKFYAVRGRRSDSKQHLLDLIKYYNYIHQDSDVPPKRQVPSGFHFVRGRRTPPFKRPSSKVPVTRRDPPISGFHFVRGKK